MWIAKYVFLLSTVIFISDSSAQTSATNYSNCATNLGTLERALYETEGNLFHLNEIFYPPSLLPTRFIKVNYTFINDEDSSMMTCTNVTYVWAVGEILFLQPPTLFKLNSLFFYFPNNELTVLDLTLPYECLPLITGKDHECTCSNDSVMLDVLTQQLNIYAKFTSQDNIQRSNTFARAVCGGELFDKYYNGKSDYTYIIVAATTFGPFLLLLLLTLAAVFSYCLADESSRDFTKFEREKQERLIALIAIGILVTLYILILDTLAMNIVSNSRHEYAEEYEQYRKGNANTIPVNLWVTYWTFACDIIFLFFFIGYVVAIVITRICKDKMQEEMQGQMQIEMQGQMQEEIEMQGQMQEEIEMQGQMQEEMQGQMQEEIEMQGQMQEEMQGQMQEEIEMQGQMQEEMQGQMQEEIEMQGQMQEEMQGQMQEEMQGQMQEEIEMQGQMQGEMQGQMQEEIEMQGQMQEEIQGQMQKDKIASCMGSCCKKCCKVPLPLDLLLLTPIACFISHLGYIILAWLTEPSRSTTTLILYYFIFFYLFITIRKSYKLLRLCKKECCNTDQESELLKIITILLSVMLSTFLGVFFLGIAVVFIMIVYLVPLASEELFDYLFTVIQFMIIVISTQFAYKLLAGKKFSLKRIVKIMKAEIAKDKAKPGYEHYKDYLSNDDSMAEATGKFLAEKLLHPYMKKLNAAGRTSGVQDGKSKSDKLDVD